MAVPSAATVCSAAIAVHPLAGTLNCAPVHATATIRTVVNAAMHQSLGRPNAGSTASFLFGRAWMILFNNSQEQFDDYA